MASIGGSGFVMVETPDGHAELFDGNNAMPLTTPGELGQGMQRVFFKKYANGMYTGIAAGSVAVPGILAALHSAWAAHGKLGWEALFEPALEFAREGIDFPATSAYYLEATWPELWSQFAETRALFTHDGDSDIYKEGDRFRQPQLAESLTLVARNGPEVFYEGELGRSIVDRIAVDGGLLTLEDLSTYKCETRVPIATTAFGWKVESNPPPAVGGAVLIHMLSLLDGARFEDPLERLTAVIQAERDAVGYRLEHYEDPGEVASALEDALTRLRSRGAGSPSTTHMSTADSDGLLCAITESNGYSSGLVVEGMLLNNTLGEEELNPQGAHGLPPGSRCHSNMTPTVARSDDEVIALGSPGADRIVNAIAHTLMAMGVDGRDLHDAILAPRAHLARMPDGETLYYEPGLPGESVGIRAQAYDDLHMFFGGVNAVSFRSDGTLAAEFDPRRSGSAALG